MSDSNKKLFTLDRIEIIDKYIDCKLKKFDVFISNNQLKHVGIERWMHEFDNKNNVSKVFWQFELTTTAIHLYTGFECVFSET